MSNPNIISEIYKAMEFLLENCKCPVDKLGILAAIGSYGDTLEDAEILTLLQDWNENHFQIISE